MKKKEHVKTMNYMREFIAIVLLFGEVEEFETAEIMIERVKKISTDMVANTITALEKKDGDILLDKKNPFLKEFRKIVEETTDCLKIKI